MKKVEFKGRLYVRPETSIVELEDELDDFTVIFIVVS